MATKAEALVLLKTISPNDLQTLGVADLAAMIKATDSAQQILPTAQTLAWPKINSVSHQMGKQNQIEWLKAFHYGTGSIEKGHQAFEVGTTNYEASMAKAQAKKKAKKLNAPLKVPPAPGLVGTNCAASLGVQVTESALNPQAIAIMLADLVDDFKGYQFTVSKAPPPKLVNYYKKDAKRILDQMADAAGTAEAASAVEVQAAQALHTALAEIEEIIGHLDDTELTVAQLGLLRKRANDARKTVKAATFYDTAPVEGVLKDLTNVAGARSQSLSADKLNSLKFKTLADALEDGTKHVDDVTAEDWAEAVYELVTNQGELESASSSGVTRIAKGLIPYDEQRLASAINTVAEGIDQTKLISDPYMTQLSLVELRTDLKILAASQKFPDATSITVRLDDVLAVADSNIGETKFANYVLDVESEYFPNINELEAALDDILENVYIGGLSDDGADTVMNGVADLAEALADQIKPGITPPSVLGNVQDIGEQLTGLDGITDAYKNFHSFKRLEVASQKLIDATGGGSFSEEVVAQASVQYAKMTSKELKVLAGNVAEEMGLPKATGNAWMSKPTMVKFLAKNDLGATLDDVAAEIGEAAAKKAKHKANYIANKAKKSGVTAGADDVANITTGKTSVKAAQQQADEAAGDISSAKYAAGEATDHQPHLHPAADAPDIPEAQFHKPVQGDHTWKPISKRKDGGVNEGQLYTDENGDVWMFKVQHEVPAQAETYVHELGWELGYEMADIRYVDDWVMPNGAIRKGTIQRFHKPVKGTLAEVTGGGGKHIAVEGLTQQQVEGVQVQQVLDWLTSNHDGHGANFVVHADDGRVIGIDKGQAFKWFGNDALSITHDPNGGNVASRMWIASVNDELAAGVVPNFDVVADVIARIEAMPEARMTELLERYMKAKFKGRGHRLGRMNQDFRTFETFVEGVLDRKRNIRRDFTAFYKDVARQQGREWTPAWEVAERVTGHKPGAATTPLNQAFAERVKDSNTLGKSLHLAGDDINTGQALVWTEQQAGGGTVLRVEMRLGSEADGRMTQRLAGVATNQPGATPQVKVGHYFSDPALDPDFKAIKDAAKTVNHHTKVDAGVATIEGELNQQKLDALIPVKTKLQKATAEAHDANLAYAAGDIDVEEWAAKQAEAQKARIYLQQIDDIQDAVDFPKKLAHTEPFDTEAAGTVWEAKAPGVNKAEVQAHVTELSHPDPIVGVVERDETFMKLKEVKGGGDNLGRWQRPKSESSRQVVSTGREYAGTLPRVVGDANDSTTMTFSSFSQTQNYGTKGKISVVHHDWDGSAETVEEILSSLRDLGVDVRLADEVDEALTFWRVTMGSFKNSVEYARPSKATGAYKQIRPAIDRIESRVAALGKGHTRADEIAIHREEWARVFPDGVDGATERLLHLHDQYGREAGWGYYDRFDLPDDLSGVFDKQGRSMTIARKGNTEEGYFEKWGAVVSNGEKRRVGGSLAGTSPTADMQAGGGNYVFASGGVSGWQSSGPLQVMNTNIRRRLSSSGAPRDAWGTISKRIDENYLNPNKWSVGTGTGSSTNELLARDMVSLWDDVEFMGTKTQAEAEHFVASMRAQGVTEINGKRVEDMVGRRGSRGNATDEIIERVSGRQNVYLRNIPDPGDLTGPQIPAVPKTTKVARAKRGKASAKVVPQGYQPSTATGINVDAQSSVADVTSWLTKWDDSGFEVGAKNSVASHKKMLASELKKLDEIAALKAATGLDLGDAKEIEALFEFYQEQKYIGGHYIGAGGWKSSKVANFDYFAQQWLPKYVELKAKFPHTPGTSAAWNELITHQSGGKAWVKVLDEHLTASGVENTGEVLQKFKGMTGEEIEKFILSGDFETEYGIISKGKVFTGVDKVEAELQKGVDSLNANAIAKKQVADGYPAKGTDAYDQLGVSSKQNKISAELAANKAQNAADEAALDLQAYKVGKANAGSALPAPDLPTAEAAAAGKVSPPADVKKMALLEIKDEYTPHEYSTAHEMWSETADELHVAESKLAATQSGVDPKSTIDALANEVQTLTDLETESFAVLKHAEKAAEGAAEEVADAAIDVKAAKLKLQKAAIASDVNTANGKAKYNQAWQELTEAETNYTKQKNIYGVLTDDDLASLTKAVDTDALIDDLYEQKLKVQQLKDEGLFGDAKQAAAKVNNKLKDASPEVKQGVGAKLNANFIAKENQAKNLGSKVPTISELDDLKKAADDAQQQAVNAVEAFGKGESSQLGINIAEEAHDEALAALDAAQSAYDNAPPVGTLNVPKPPGGAPALPKAIEDAYLEVGLDDISLIEKAAKAGIEPDDAAVYADLDLLYQQEFGPEFAKMQWLDEFPDVAKPGVKVGTKVLPHADSKVYKYGIGQHKVEVQFVKGGDEVAAKHPYTHEWFIVDESYNGKADLKDVIQALYGIGDLI